MNKFPITGLRHHDFKGRLDELFEPHLAHQPTEHGQRHAAVAPRHNPPQATRIMTEEQKLQWLQSLMTSGVIVNQLNLGDGTQNIYINGTRKETASPSSDTAVQQAILDLYEATFEEAA